MASALSDRLSRIVKEMRGQARITEGNVADMLREVRMALLEADVALPVVRDFIARVKEKALGQEVIGSLSPGQALVSIVNRELAATMGEGVSDINLAAQPPAVILMAGLQGAGKTTTTAKLAKHLIEKRKKKVLTVSGDVYRPAAIEQLKTVTAQAGATWFESTPDQLPQAIAKAALDHARREEIEQLGVRGLQVQQGGLHPERIFCRNVCTTLSFAGTRTRHIVPLPATSACTMFTPLPPGSVSASLARCLRPDSKLGTLRVRSSAALSVTVRIMRTRTLSRPGLC